MADPHAAAQAAADFWGTAVNDPFINYAQPKPGFFPALSSHGSAWETRLWLARYVRNYSIMVRLWGAKAGGEDTRGALYIWGDRGYQDQWFVPCPACTNLVEHGDLVICELAADTAALKSVGETYVDARGSELDGRFGGRSEHFGDTLSVESATASSSQMFWFDGWKGGGRDSKRYAAIRQSLLGLATQECDAVHRNQIETGGETAAADRPQRGPRDHLGVQ